MLFWWKIFEIVEISAPHNYKRTALKFTKWRQSSTWGQVGHLPQVDEWRFVTAPAVAHEDLGRHEAAIVKISWMACWRFLNAGKPRRHFLAHGADHDRHISDGRLGLGRLVADIVKVDLLVQRLGRIRQTRHHEVVGYTRAFVLHHLPSPPTACMVTENDRERDLVRAVK